MPQQFFSFESELQNTTPELSSSHCSSVQERFVTYGSEALDSSEHLGVVLGSQKDANALLQPFGSLAILAQASVEQLVPFISRSKAIRLVSSLRMGAVTLREERRNLSPLEPTAAHLPRLCAPRLGQFSDQSSR
jgi:DNA repair protein RadC